MTPPTLGHTLKDSAEMLQGFLHDAGAASRLPEDLIARLGEAAQHAQTLREAARQLTKTRDDWRNIADIPTLAASQQSLIDLLRAVADWLAPEAEK